MSQLTYNQDPAEAFAGMPSDNRDLVVESGIALEALAFGLGLVDSKLAAEAKSVRLPRRNKLELVFSADLVTSNTVNGSINGEAIAQVTFSSNHATSMALVKTAIETVLTTLGLTGTVTVGGSSDRTITVLVNENVNLLAASWVVAAGSSQATVTPAHNTQDVFRGINLHSHKSVSDAGVAGVQIKQAANLARRGKVHVMVGANVLKGEAAYIIAATSGREGMFTNVATNNIATGGVFRKATSGSSTPALGEVEINLP